MSGKKSIQEELADKSREVHEQLVELMKNPDALTPLQRDELKAMIAAAGISGSALKAPQKEDALGDKMHEETLGMIEKAHDPRPGNSRATIDPQKLIETAVRLQKTIERENANREERLKQLEETGEKLKAGIDAIIGGIEKTEADWRKQGCPVTKPVTVGRPLKLKKPAP